MEQGSSIGHLEGEIDAIEIQLRAAALKKEDLEDQFETLQESLGLKQ
jgi:hypothetical protein